MSAGHSWTVLDREEMPQVVDEPIESCFLGKVFCVYEGRNTYQGPQNYRYSIFPTKSHAAADVEPRRTQGSPWRIVETPAIALQGTNNALLLVDLASYTKRVFQSWPVDLTEQLTVLSLVCFPLCGDIRARVLCSPVVALPASLPFFTWYSRPQGAGMVLGWDETSNDFDLSRAHEVVTNITRRLQKNANA
jgi:hypothetical protein